MPVEFVKWCCVNSTMTNRGDMVHCYVATGLTNGGILERWEKIKLVIMEA
ncbi:hypothetical protein YC2023_008835 [Brassica napus]